METSFLSGSENLYKYLVSVGLLLMVMTVFYPLKEKQEIEISTIKLEKEVLKLNFKIKDNYKKVKELKAQRLLTRPLYFMIRVIQDQDCGSPVQT